MKKFTTKVTIVLVLILVCVLSMAVLVACGEKDQHEHNYSAWGSDDNDHWKVCPDDNAIDESSKGAHIDSDGDGICDTCGKTGMHVHDFSGEWQKDAEGHWKACPTDGATDTKANHIDSNSDEICDACGWNMHVHSYGTEWITNESKHWHVCSCGNAKSDEDNHIDSDNNCACDVCGYPMHQYSTTWSSDGTNHWHQCTVCNDKKDEAAHVYGAGSEVCTICQYDSHTHAYGNDWKSNNTEHWQECSCGSQGNKSNHIDEDNDCKCDTCDHDMHGPSKTWSSDETGHWYECSNCQGKIDFATHVDEDDDDFCDICEYDMHVHNYGTEWITSATKHWHACSCGDLSDEADHTDTDDDGLCDVCGNHYYCFDEDSDGNCDVTSCGKHIHCVDHDGNFKCDTCGETMTEHEHSYSVKFDQDSNSNDIIPTADTPANIYLVCTNDGDEDHNYCIDKKIENVKNIAYGEQITITATAGEDVYLYMDAITASLTRVTLGEGTSLQLVTAKAYDDSEWIYLWTTYNSDLKNSSDIVLGVGTSYIRNYQGMLFKATATDGNISFKLSDAPGSSKALALDITKGTEYTGKDSKWLKYTPSADEELVVYNGESSINYADGYLNVTHATISMYVGDSEDSQDIDIKYTVISMTSGTTYYFYLPGMGIDYNTGDQTYYTFKLMDKEAGKSYLGYSTENPIEITDGTVTANSDIIGTRYYKWTADKTGNVVTTIIATPDGAYAVATLLEYIYGGWYQSWDEVYSIEADDTIMFSVDYYSSEANGSYTLSVKSEEPQPTDHTITIKDYDGNALKDVTVSITIDADTTVTGTTDSDGKVTLNFLPGTYDIVLSGYDTAKYLYDTESTSALTTEYEIELINIKKTNTFKVKTTSGEGVSGVTVKVMDGATEIASGTTGSDGTITLTYDGKIDGSYGVALSGYGDNYYPKASGYNFNAATDGGTINCNLYVYTTYTVTVKLDDGITGISIEGLTVELSQFGSSVGSGKTDANGVVTIKTSATASRPVDAKVTGLSALYSASASIAGGSTSGTITICNNDKLLQMGDNEVTANLDDSGWSYAYTEWIFASETGGVYTITINDTIGSAAVYLSTGRYAEAVLSTDEYELKPSYSFSLKAGEYITFYITSNNYELLYSEAPAHTYTLNIATATPVTELSEGNNLVEGKTTADNLFGTALTFTSEYGGDYTISSSDENCWFTLTAGDEYNAYTTGNVCSFTLEEGGSITIYFGTYDMGSDSSLYIVTIAEDYGYGK